MKKSIGVALALMMTVSMPVCAMAEEEAGSSPDNPVVFSYSDIDDSVYEGTWYKTGLGFDVYLPDDWEVSDVPEEAAEQGVVFIAGEDEENGGANMIINCAELPEEAANYDLATLGEDLSATYPSMVYADLNGIPAVVFESDENEISGFAFLTEDNYIVSGVISPSPEIGYEEYSPYFKNMIISVSPTEEESTEADTEA